MHLGHKNNLIRSGRAFVIILIMFFSLSAHRALAGSSGDFVSVQDGNWNDGATWGNASPGVEGIDYPGGTGDVDVAINHNVTVTQDQSAPSITINSSGVLDLGAQTFTVFGDFTNNGTLNAGTSTVIFAGGFQSILGESTFHNLTKTTSVEDTLTFEPEKTTTVTGTLALNGTAAGLLTVNNQPSNPVGPPFFDLNIGAGTDPSEGGNFNSPQRITIDSAGNKIVADTNNNRIQKFDPADNFLFTFGGGVQDGSSTFQICTSNCRAGNSGSGNGLFSNPSGVTTDSSGNIYVADSDNNRIEKFDSNGNFMSKFGVSGSGEGQFNSPSGVTIDSLGNIYVADLNNNRIQKFNSAGTFQFTFGWGVQDGTPEFQVCTSGCQEGISGSGNGQFNNPIDVAIDSLNNLYVADAGNNRIVKFDSVNGDFLPLILEGSGSGAGQFNFPWGVTTDSSGNIYVADNNNHRVQKFDSDGTFIFTFGWGVLDGTEEFQICTSSDPSCQAGLQGVDDSRFTFPKSVAIDSGGNIYVADSANNNVQKFDPAGNFISKLKSKAPEGILENPQHVAIDSLGNIYVADVANNRVQEFGPTGNFLRTFGWGVQDGTSAFQVCTSNCQRGIAGTGDGQMTPSGIAIDSSGDILVTDPLTARVQKFHPNGNSVNFVSTFGWGVQDGSSALQTCFSGCQAGISGSGDGQFSFPTAVTTDSADNIYVVDNGNNRIQIFNFNLNLAIFLSAFGGSGSDKGEFNNPFDVATDSANNIYVADADNHRIQKFHFDGINLVNFVSMFGWGVQDDTIEELQVCTSSDPICHTGIPGSGDGQFTSPLGISIDPSGNILVSDLNNRVQEFGPAGNFLFTFGWGVKDGTSNEFQVCNSGCHAGLAGSGDGQFFFPSDVTTDSANRIYVVDGNNNRIQKFTQLNTHDFWGLNSQGSASLSYLDVFSSHATSPVTCNNCTDEGNNINWIFQIPSSPLPPPPPPTGGGGGLPEGALNPPVPPPGGFGVTINKGDASTSTAVTTLSLRGGPDTVRMAISNAADFHFISQEDYAPTKTWNLCWENDILQTPSNCPSGTYTVYAKFYNRSGQISGTVSDTIVYQSGFGSGGKLVLDRGVIYFIYQGTKRPFVSMAVFSSYGYKLSNVIKQNTGTIAEGEPILIANQRHPDGTLVIHLGTVYLIGANFRYGFPSAAVFRSWGNQFKDVVPANSLDLLLPEGAIVQMRP